MRVDVNPVQQLSGQEARLANWRTAGQSEVDALGWTRFVRVDDPDEDLRVACLDVSPQHDISVVAEGPATFCIAIMLEGLGSVSIDGGKPLDVRSGTAVVFSSEGVVRGENTIRANHRVRIVDIRYERKFLDRAGSVPFSLLKGSLFTDRSVLEQKALLIGFPCSAGLIHAARQIADCPFELDSVRRLFLRAKALEVFALVVAALTASAPPLLPLNSRDRRKLDEARRILQDRFGEAWTIARLAREIGLNERKLKSGFRHVVGRSIHDYLRDVRIAAAASMLEAGASVTEAAIAVGFSSLSHFSKVFRSRNGQGPREFRLTHARGES